jgi:hypothetical protein
MPDPQQPSQLATFFSTLYGRIIGALTIIALLIGIALGSIELVTAYYNMLRSHSDAIRANAEASAASGSEYRTGAGAPSKESAPPPPSSRWQSLSRPEEK